MKKTKQKKEINYGLVMVNALRKATNQPEFGKQYALTGKTGDKCISNGNSWSESEVKEEK